jgi:hypothetical protein
VRNNAGGLWNHGLFFLHNLAPAYSQVGRAWRGSGGHLCARGARAGSAAGVLLASLLRFVVTCVDFCRGEAFESGATRRRSVAWPAGLQHFWPVLAAGYSLYTG